MKFSGEQRSLCEDLSVSSVVSIDTFETFDVGMMLIGLKVLSLDTKNMVDTDVRIPVYDNESLMKLFHIADTMVGDSNALYGDEILSKFRSEERIKYLLNVVYPLSENAVKDFDSFFGENSMSKIVSHRFGYSLVPDIRFTLCVCTNILTAIANKSMKSEPPVQLGDVTSLFALLFA